MEDDFYIFLTFDIDQDFNPLSDDYYNRSSASFSSFESSVLNIIEELNGSPFSVFVRADYQIKKIYGRYGYLIEEHKNVRDAILNSNGEINWHIHLYKELNKEWVQIKDEKELCDRFSKDFESVKNIENINSNIVRIGECVMNNKLMSTLNKHSIKIDSSALPKRKRMDEDKHFDWETTSNKFYKPTTEDYRVENSSKESYNLLEIPMTTIPMKASYDTQAFNRYFNLSFKTDVLFENMDEYIKNNNYLVTMTHPFELVGDTKHGLISYNFEVFKENLKTLVQCVKGSGKRPVFKKIGDILNEDIIK